MKKITKVENLEEFCLVNLAQFSIEHIEWNGIELFPVACGYNYMELMFYFEDNSYKVIFYTDKNHQPKNWFRIIHRFDPIVPECSEKQLLEKLLAIQLKYI